MKIYKFIIIIFLLLILILNISCASYGYLKPDSLFIKFPIKLQTKDKNVEYDVTIPDEYFRLRVKGIKKIQLNKIDLFGDFDVKFAYDWDWSKSIDDDSTYLFYRVYITGFNDTSIKDVAKKIIDQQVILVPTASEKGFYSFIDVDNKMSYHFNFVSKEMRIDDLKEVYFNSGDKYKSIIEFIYENY